MAPITGLPTELLLNICAFSSDDEILSFALICRRLYDASSDELRARQGIFQRFETVDDKDPIEFLDRLRQIMHDPFKARCVRSLQFSAMRTTWEDWSEPRALQGHSSDDNQAWKRYYSYDDLETFRHLLRTEMFHGFSGNTLTNAHISMLRNGHDDALKILWITLCPRVHTLTLYELRSTPSVRRAQPHPLKYSFLSRAGSAARLTTWPSGFRSLRSVSLCAPIDGVEETWPYHLRPAHVSGLFWLPNIEHLELRQMRYRHDGDNWLDVEAGCSNVKSLKFDSCDTQHATLLRFVTSPRQLEKLSITRSGDLPSMLHQWLRQCYGASLQIDDT
jgi:hypothetical protein